MSIGKGIPISTGFDLNSQSPLDNRTIFKTIEERDSLPSINLYEGLECFVEDTKIKYQYLNGQWEEIGMWDDATVTKDIVNNRNEISFYSKGTLKKTIYIDGLGGGNTAYQIEKGENTPTDESILIWIDTSEESLSSSLTDELIIEFKSVIADLNSQITDLKARVLYLEQNSGGGTVTDDSSYVMLEDDT